MLNGMKIRTVLLSMKIYIVVDVLSLVIIFCFSFVLGYGNVANEVETKGNLKLPEIKNNHNMYTL